jgi:hypothetical protein
MTWNQLHERMAFMADRSGRPPAAARRSPRVRSVQRDEEHIVKVFDDLPTNARRAVA